MSATEGQRQRDNTVGKSERVAKKQNFILDRSQYKFIEAHLLTIDVYTVLTYYNMYLGFDY